MKILMINDYSDSPGGDKTHIQDLSSALIKKGHDVFFLGYSLLRSSRSSHLRIIKHSPNILSTFINRYFFNFRLYAELRNCIRSIKPDIIHLHTIDVVSAKTTILASRGFRKIHTLHNFTAICPVNFLYVKKRMSLCTGRKLFKCSRDCKHLIVDLLSNSFLNNFFLEKMLVDCFICPSKILKSNLKNYGFKNMIYLPHFIDTLFWCRINHQKPVDTVIYTGRLSEEKGVGWLIKSFRLVVDKIGSAKLIIIGEGEHKNYLEKLSIHTGLEKNIRFMGFLDREEIVDIYKDACVSIVPSVCMEMFGLVVLESMATGTPVIGSNVGGIPELIEDGVNGYLVDRFDTRALSDKIIYLLQNKKFAMKMGENGRKMVKERFGAEKYISKIQNIYYHVLKNKTTN